MRERLARERSALADARGAKANALAERVLAIRRDCAGRLREPFATGDPGTLLHGDDGLPLHALAKALDEPLLFKGDLFGHTDVDVAPWPRDPA